MLQNFANNDDIIEAHNNQKLSFELGHNKVTRKIIFLPCKNIKKNIYINIASPFLFTSSSISSSPTFPLMSGESTSASACQVQPRERLPHSPSRHLLMSLPSLPPLTGLLLAPSPLSRTKANAAHAGVSVPPVPLKVLTRTSTVLFFLSPSKTSLIATSEPTVAKITAATVV